VTTVATGLGVVVAGAVRSSLLHATIDAASKQNAAMESFFIIKPPGKSKIGCSR
jgi:hypothetical protein